MNQINQLSNIAGKETRSVIGLMSGTSLDGLDIALCTLRGSGRSTEITVKAFATKPYDASTIDLIKSVFAKTEVNLEKLCELNAEIGRLHGRLVKEQLAQWHIATDSVDLIASHGQTVFHAPKQSSEHLGCNSTLQIGDGDHVARECGIITISDFRQRHIAAGGEGAPLVAYGDSLLFQADEPRLLLNIGGIANFTYLPGSHLKSNNLPNSHLSSSYLPSRNDDSAILCSDIGPGNTLMDAYVQAHTDEDYDHDGQLAAAGEVNSSLLQALISHPFFSESFPKTTGPELFNLTYLDNAMKVSATSHLGHNDVLSTLNAFSAKSIVSAIEAILDTEDLSHIYISGGGYKNTHLIENIRNELPNMNIQSTNDIGIDPDAKEAVLFALLANECVAGNHSETINISGMPSTTMGKICFPA